jgi:predicted DNA-binding mobile mystery protein A
MLTLRQVENALSEPRPIPPKQGWIKTIREALGMTTRQLGERMRIPQSNVVALERREVLGTASFAQIQRAANALDCDALLVLVPRMPLTRVVENQAREIATRNVKGVTHTMRLEAQEPSSEFVTHQIDSEVEKLLAGTWSKLWRQSAH